jgi:hypothetical protein
MDLIRSRMNSDFWLLLKEKLDISFLQRAPEWQIKAIEDRTGIPVGLQCLPKEHQDCCLTPMLEQQCMNGDWRIFSGLMWQGEAQMTTSVGALKQAFADCRSNANFLAWRWMNFHPRKRSFLLKLAEKPDQLLNEIASVFMEISLDKRELIDQANAELKSKPGQTGLG